MTVMYYDVTKRVGEKLLSHRARGTTYDVILYADDTICISESEEAMKTAVNSESSESLVHAACKYARCCGPTDEQRAKSDEEEKELAAKRQEEENAHYQAMHAEEKNVAAQLRENGAI